MIFIDNFAITEENWLKEWKENSPSKNELLAISIGPRSDHSPPMSATKLRPCWNQVWPSALFGRYLGTKWGPLHCHCSRMMKTIVIVWKQKSQTTKVERENICEERLFAEKISSELFDNARPTYSLCYSTILTIWTLSTHVLDKKSRNLLTKILLAVIAKPPNLEAHQQTLYAQNLPTFKY